MLKIGYTCFQKLRHLSDEHVEYITCLDNWCLLPETMLTGIELDKSRYSDGSYGNGFPKLPKHSLCMLMEP